MTRHLTILLVLLSACAAPPPAAPLLTPPAATAPPLDAVLARPVATIDGYVHDGQVEITVRDVDGRIAQAATDSPLPTMTSGTAGTTTPAPNNLLLHQNMVRSLDGACEAAPYGDPGIPTPFRGVCFSIMAANGYAQYVLNTYVQLTSVTYCGPLLFGAVTTYVKDPSNTLIGVDNTYGLWYYGHLRPAGMPLDRSNRNWYFQTPDPGATTCFRWTGIVMGELFTL